MRIKPIAQANEQARAKLMLLAAVALLQACSDKGSAPGPGTALSDVAPSHTEEVMFEIPGEATVAGTLLNPKGSGIAMFLRMHDSVRLVASGFATASFDGYTHYQRYSNDGFAWHVLQPMGKELDKAIVGTGSKEGSWLDWGSEEDFAKALKIDSTGKHVAFTIYDDGEWKQSVDFVAQAGYESVGRLRFSPNGRHYAYIGISGGIERVILDGTEVDFRLGADDTDVTGVIDNSLRVTASGKVFFVTEVDGGYRVYWDKGFGETFPALGANYTVDEQNDRYGFSAERNGQWFYVIDGVKTQPYEHVGPLYFSQAGDRHAFTAERGGSMFYVVDGKEHPPFQGVSQAVFGPSGDGFVYAGSKDGDAWSIVRDGETVVRKGNIYNAVYSDDGKRLAYCMTDAGKIHMYLDDELLWSLEGVPERPIRHDGTLDNIGIIVRRGNQRHAVINGTVGPAFNFAGGLSFSPNGERFAYVAGKDSTRYVVINGQARPIDYKSIPTFSVRNNLAIAVQEGEQTQVLVDDQPIGSYARIHVGSDGLGFRPDGALEFMAERFEGESRSIVRVVNQPGTGPGT